jgi:hypothetical protein
VKTELPLNIPREAISVLTWIVGVLVRTSVRERSGDVARAMSSGKLFVPTY